MLAIFAAMIIAAGPPVDWNTLVGVGAIFGSFWFVLAILAFAVGSLVTPPGKAKRRA